MSIYLTAIVKSKPGFAEPMKALLLNMVEGSRKEEACIHYDLHQSTEDENMFIFHEEWASMEALQPHSETPHVNAFREQSVDIIDGALALHFTKKLS
jgi:quinol monooxygenase YgiN